MRFRLFLPILPFGALVTPGCGGGGNGSASADAAVRDTAFGTVVTRAVGDGLRKPVIVSTSGATFVGVAGASFSSVALVNPPPLSVGEETAPLAFVGSRSKRLTFFHPATGRVRGLSSYLTNTADDIAVSPDGWRVAYVDASGLRTVLLDGTANTLIKSGRVHQVAFSPDGNLLAYLIKDHNGNSRIGTIRPDGSGDRLLPVAADLMYDVRFLPDGTRIVYSSGASFNASRLLSVSLDGLTPELYSTWPSEQFGFAAGGEAFLGGDGTLSLRVDVNAIRANPAVEGMLGETLSIHPQLPFFSYTNAEGSAKVNLLNGGPLVKTYAGYQGPFAFLPYRTRRDVVAAGTADPLSAGFVASSLGRFTGSYVGWDAQTRPATAVVAEPVLSGSDSVVFTVDAGASNKITRVFSLESVWEPKISVALGAPADGLVIMFDAATGLPGAIIPYIATRGSGKPKITRLPGGGVRVEGDLEGVYGEGGTLLSGPTDRYETSGK